MVNKFAHVTGGADRYCLSVIEELRARGHDVQLLSTASDENREHAGGFVPLRVDRQTRDSLPVASRLGVARDAVWNSAALSQTLELLSSFRPDVVHAHKLYPQLSVTPVVAAARTRTPVVQTIHDYEFVSASALDHTGRRIDHDELRRAYRGLNTLLFQVKRRMHAPRVDRWIAISDYVGQVYGRRGIASTVIPHFIAPAEPGPIADRDGIVYAGRLSRDKGVAGLPELARQVPEARITVLGDGPLRGWLTRQAEGLDGRLELAGEVPHDDVIERMRRARVVVVPSVWPEPAGLVALEAMAVGTPVVVYAGGGMSEYVGSAGGGVVTEPRVEAMADQVRRLIGPSRMWAQLSRRGRDGVRAEFTADRHVAQLEQVYAAAVAGGAVSNAAPAARAT